VFERYAIISQSDIHDAMTKLEVNSDAIKRTPSNSKNQHQSSLGRLWAELTQNGVILTADPYHLARKLTSVTEWVGLGAGRGS
jgi:hypothetical protein